MSKQTWIEEREAAKVMGYRDKKYFRRLVKKGTYSVSYRCNPKGRSYEYDLKAIEQLKNQNSFIIH